MTDLINKKSLLSWYDAEKRCFPWRLSNNPYEILIAGVLLRKTTAKQVSSVYPDFIERFPNPEAVQKASTQILEKHLRPLGIYRVRSEQIKKMCDLLILEHDCLVPKDITSLVKLPGISDYIANSVLCFAYNERLAIVDTNVLRIYRRLTGDNTLSKKEAIVIAQNNLPKTCYKEFNWALLDLAAKVCMARNPRCRICPISSCCQYFTAGNN